MIYTIIIPDWHPAKVNELLREHWSKASKLKRRDRNMIWGYSRHVLPAEGKRRVSLTITTHGRGRKPDPDAHIKSLLDALVKNKLLVDDSMAWVENTPVQIMTGERKQTTITLEDIE